MNRTLITVALAFLLFGCATGGVEPIDGIRLNPLPPDAPVYVYSSESEIHAPYKVVGLLSYTDPGKYQILSLQSVIPKLKEKAREAGGNGVIVDETHVVKSGIISTGISVKGRVVVVEK